MLTPEIDLSAVTGKECRLAWLLPCFKKSSYPKGRLLSDSDGDVSVGVVARTRLHFAVLDETIAFMAG